MCLSAGSCLFDTAPAYLTQTEQQCRDNESGLSEIQTGLELVLPEDCLLTQLEALPPKAWMLRGLLLGRGSVAETNEPAD